MSWNLQTLNEMEGWEPPEVGHDPDDPRCDCWCHGYVYGHDEARAECRDTILSLRLTLVAFLIGVIGSFVGREAGWW